MRSDWSHLERWRISDFPDNPHFATYGGDREGIFHIYVGSGKIFICVTSSGDKEYPWEHVSFRTILRTEQRIPTWDECCIVKAMFWEDEECVIQFHPPKSEYVNQHECVLHLWRYTGEEQPRPKMEQI